MRITNQNDLKKLLDAGRTRDKGMGMASSVRAQIETALSEVDVSERQKSDCPIKKAKASVPVESVGEAWLRIALTAEFGDWFQGGELVQELELFKKRKFRADFTLPRYSIYIECDGWSFHGKHLEEHHADRLRALYYSRHNWLPFRVSHGQAKANVPELIDSIKSAMAYRTPVPRNSIEIRRRKHPSGYRCSIHPAVDDVPPPQ